MGEADGLRSLDLLAVPRSLAVCCALLCRCACCSCRSGRQCCRECTIEDGLDWPAAGWRGVGLAWTSSKSGNRGRTRGPPAVVVFISKAVDVWQISSAWAVASDWEARNVTDAPVLTVERTSRLLSRFGDKGDEARGSPPLLGVAQVPSQEKFPRRSSLSQMSRCRQEGVKAGGCAWGRGGRKRRIGTSIAYLT